MRDLRVLRNLLDAAWGDFPTNDVGFDWARYTGNARPEKSWVDAVLEHSLVTFIQETTSQRSQEGPQAGVYDCQFAEYRARQRMSNPLSIIYVVSDGNYADVWDAGPYGSGIGSVATIPFLFYGTPAICKSAALGAGNSPLNLMGDHVPETWGGTSAPMRRLITQHVGPSPVPNTDLNTVHDYYYPVAPVAPAWKDYDMHIGVNKTEGWFVVDGGKITSHFTGPAGAYGVPADLAGKWVEVPSKVYTDAEVNELKKGVSVGSVSVDIDYEKMAQAVTAGMRGL